MLEPINEEWRFCPPSKVLSSRGDKAVIQCLESNPSNYVHKDQCYNCKYRLFRILDVGCPNEVEKARFKTKIKLRDS